MKPFVELANKLFESREKAHVFHLTIKSHENHMATQFYYEGILDVIDNLVEVWQGKYGMIEDYQFADYNSETDPIKYFEDLSKFIEMERYNFIPKEDTFLHNILDESLELLYKTLYKLKYLK